MKTTNPSLWGLTPPSAFGVLSWCAWLQFLPANSSSGTAAVCTHREMLKEGLPKGLCLCFHPVGAGHQVHLWGKGMEKHWSKSERVKHLSCFFLSLCDFFLLSPLFHFYALLFLLLVNHIFFKHKPSFPSWQYGPEKCRYQETVKSWHTLALLGLMMGVWEMDEMSSVSNAHLVTVSLLRELL